MTTTRRLAIMAVASVLLFMQLPAQAAQLPDAVPDQEFWRLVTEFSEPAGVFQPQFMSNEDSLQFVIPALKETTRRGGVYIGVGPEQNFTYIAAIEPRLVFIVDIRRDNMLQHLIYKALFELSRNRADFLSRLFSRSLPAGLDVNAGGEALFRAYAGIEGDPKLYNENLRAVINRLAIDHRFTLSESDKANIARLMDVFAIAGPQGLRGSGDKNASYAQLMTASDLTGHQHGYLASEKNFRIVQSLERRNLVIPLVGDFAGDKAIMNVGRYLKDRGAIVDVFYLSNVERYLFDQGDYGKRFYSNVALLPVNRSSTFIRSVTVDISRRLGIPLTDGAANWRSFLSPIDESLKAFSEGRLQTYRDLFEIRR